MTSNENVSDLFFVVMNSEDQYSLWRTDLKMPMGWSAVSPPLPKEQCLDEIEKRWVDMRPRSLREAMNKTI